MELLFYDKIMNIENPKESTKMILRLTSELRSQGKSSVYKISCVSMHF